MRTEISIDPNAIYTTNQVVELLGVSSELIAKARRRGNLSGVKRGLHWFYRGDILIRWLTIDDSSSAEQKRNAVHQ